MKVAILSNSDSLGGAAIVTRRLMTALRRAGVDARMIVYSKLTDDENVEMLNDRTKRNVMFIKERLRIYGANGFSRENLFKVSTADSGVNLSRNKWIREADVIVLGWINQGFLSLKGIRKLAALGKPIVWIMHDMWNLTGICHHAYECRRYELECGCCPLLCSSSPNDLSHHTWVKKMKLYDDVPIHFVAVSNWLAEKCERSSLMKGRDITVIPNAFPIDLFSTKPQSEIKVSALNYSKDLILMGAARLDDPIKGLDYAIDALNILFERHPEVAQRSLAVFFGSVRDKSAFDRLNYPFMLMGTVTDSKVIAEMYAASKVVLSTSLYETLPSTLIEGQAAGCVPVTFGRGGQKDIIKHKETGYIAEYLNAESVADGILWALQSNLDRDMLHEAARATFSCTSVAHRYATLFQSLLTPAK